MANHSRSSRSRPARAAGGNTRGKAAAAGDRHSATRAIAGAKANAKRSAGGQTSARSTKPPTPNGNGREPQPGQPLPATAGDLPYTLSLASQYLLGELQAEEMLAITGAGVLVMADHTIDLQYGDWILTRFWCEPDGEVERSRAFSVQL